MVRPSIEVGRNFQIPGEWPEGMLTGKKIFLVLAWGGVNPEDPMKVVDFQKPYQRHLLSFAGMKDVAFERVEGTAFGPEAAKKGGPISL